MTHTLMVGKTVLVTGGTCGIGKATAVGLARLGARVGITGRDIVLHWLVLALTGSQAALVVLGDLRSFCSARRD